MPASDEMLKISPLRAERIIGSAARVTLNTPNRLVANWA
jgi:hypothetical protein